MMSRYTHNDKETTIMAILINIPNVEWKAISKGAEQGRALIKKCKVEKALRETIEQSMA